LTNRSPLLLLLLMLSLWSQAQPTLTTPYEAGNGNQSATYAETIAWYRQLDRLYGSVRLDSVGLTDSGLPLHVVVLDADQEFDPTAARRRGKSVLFILNGIHPGEPEGIDASMLLARELVSSPAGQRQLQSVVVCIVPVFNVDGMLRRNSHSRANQNGPEAYGFRGNARNLDLNRDFTKLDSRNTRSLVGALRRWDPDLFFDTHTTNGADYQYVMTLIESQKDKMHPAVAQLMTSTLTPALYAGMAKQGFPMSPYVNTEHELPDSGLIGFLETPRYSTGYTALWHCAGYVLETHMLKAFRPRVEATLAMLRLGSSWLAQNGKQLQAARQQARTADAAQRWYPLQWQLDRSEADTLVFMGYRAARKPSEVHGGDRLYYDRQQPWQAKLHYHNRYRATDSVEKPAAYLIPGAWAELIERLDWNRIPYWRLQRDSTVTASVYTVTDYQSSRRPYEGHYLHYGIRTRSDTQQLQLRAGDVLVRTGTGHDRLVVELLEPRAVDGYLAWGFFDAVLQQKEYFSAYVFEDTAAELLRSSPELRKRFEHWRSGESTPPSAAAQLDWLYRHSPHYEGTANQYPIVRLLP
jgi:hypothetical protein